MITILNEFTYVHDMLVNFVAHIIIFIGTFYVALQNRNLKHWHLTPLWYMGLSSIFVVITIVCQWAVGPEYPMSYWNLGRLAETLSNMSIAAVALIMLISTVRIDLRNSKKRRKES